MIIVGAKGFAKEILEIFHQLNKLDNIAFYDDVNQDVGDYLYSQFTILKGEEAVKAFFLKYGNQFTIGIGIPVLRYKLYQKFQNLGGEFVSTISPLAHIGNYDVSIDSGCNILCNAVFSNSVTIGKGCIVYYNVLITHDCIVGNFVELSPCVTLLGNVQIGDFTQIGSNSTVLPKVRIGKNVIIGAGSVVTKDIPDNCLAVGSPAKVIRNLEPINH